VALGGASAGSGIKNSSCFGQVGSGELRKPVEPLTTFAPSVTR
jgi:hypothetical protein